MATAKVRIQGEDATGAAWKHAVGQANESAEKMKHAFEAAFAGISLAVVAELGKKAFEIGDHLSKAATKAGIGGKAFTELAYAAKIADVDVDALSTSIKKMQVSLSEASTGAKAPNEDLRALGLTLKQLQELKPDEQFELIGDRISQLKDPADRTRAAVELFGKAGADLLPLFEKGAAGIREAREEANKLGVVFSDEQLKKLADGEDAIKKLDSAWQSFYITVAAKAGPAVTDFLEHLSGAVSLEGQIRDTESRLKGGDGAFGIDQAPSGDEREQLERQLAFLRLKQEAASQPSLGGRGRGGPAAPGFESGADAEAAAKVNAANEAYRARISDTSAEFSALYHTMNSESEKTLHADMDREVQRQDAAAETYEKWKQSERDLAIYRQQQAAQSVEIWKDLFTSAFDDMLNTGKIHWSELLKYFIAELAKLEIGKLFESIATDKASGGTGFWSSIVGAIGSMFGGTRDSGGVGEPGKAYVITPKASPEVFVPSSRGQFYPNAGGGRGNNNLQVSIVNHYNGTSEELIRQQSRRDKDLSERIFDELSRQGYRPAGA